MKKIAAIQLSVPEPCGEAWDDMLIADGGKHCGSCQKVVVDFTGFTDEKLLAYFQNYPGALCGHFSRIQLHRVIKVQSVQQTSIYKRVAASLFIMFGLSASSNAQTKNNRDKNKTAQAPKARKNSARLPVMQKDHIALEEIRVKAQPDTTQESFYIGGAISIQRYSAGSSNPFSIGPCHSPGLQTYVILKANVEDAAQVRISIWQRLASRFSRLLR